MFGLFAMHVSDVWSYCVAIHSCVVIPHCVGVSSCVNSFASSSRKGAEVERACAAAYIQAKFGCSESANEQSSQAQGGSEPGRRGASRAMTADQVHAAAVSGSARTAGSVVVLPTPADPIGFRRSTRDVEAQSAAKEHTSEARGSDCGPGVRGPGADLGQR